MMGTFRMAFKVYFFRAIAVDTIAVSILCPVFDACLPRELSHHDKVDVSLFAFAHFLVDLGFEVLLHLILPQCSATVSTEYMKAPIAERKRSVSKVAFVGEGTHQSLNSILFHIEAG